MKIAFIISICALWLLSCVITALIGYIKRLEKDIKNLKGNVPKAVSTEKGTVIDKKAVQDLKNFYTYDGTEQA